MALLVEGLGVAEETAIEEYIRGPAHDIEEADKMNIYGHHDSQTARPIASRQGSAINQSVPLMDPLVTLFNSVHERLPDGGSRGSALFPHFGSMYSNDGNPIISEDWDKESAGNDYHSDHAAGNESDDDLHSPLISRQTTVVEKSTILPASHGLHSKDLMDERPIGPAIVHPAEATKGAIWSELCEPGVKHALFVGIGLQILQQFSGINGVLYYTPQILEEAGVGILLSNLGISSTSSSLLISNIITLLMLPCIVVAMRLMDISGRR